MIDANQMAPKFCLANPENEWTSLDEFAGKRVLLYFYQDIERLECQIVAIEFAKRIQHFIYHNVIVIGISPNSVAQLRMQSTRLYLPFHLLSDSNLEVINLYETWNKKITYGFERWIVTCCALLINEDGEIVKTFKRVGPVEGAKNIMEYLDAKREKEDWRKLTRSQKEKIKKQRQRTTACKKDQDAKE